MADYTLYSPHHIVHPKKIYYFCTKVLAVIVITAIFDLIR